ncbi:MAG: biotin-dependent carboxyltransferase family protein [Oscillochloridaceae bacterium umkhey_bin13]
MSIALHIIQPGALTTVQDAGRQAAVRFGVPRGGAMDQFALVAANRLVGNPPDAAVLELTAGGASLVSLRFQALALTGADLGATLNGRAVRPWTTVLTRPGDRLQLAMRQEAWGARAYLAVSGGLATPPVLGSRSTNLASGFGGLAGRSLRAGDQLVAAPPWCEPQRVVGRTWPVDQRPAYGSCPSLRFVPGPHAPLFDPACFAPQALPPLTVAMSSNRMGYRLEGCHLPTLQPLSLASLGVIPGVIQVPPDGSPILLMADAQTTGGYPIFGVVIAADLPLAAQLLPGDQLRLEPITVEAALVARQTMATWEAIPLSEPASVVALGLAGALA